MAANDCANLQENLQNCICSNAECGIRGICCECLKENLATNNLPACCFPEDAEKSCGGSFKRFAQLHS